MTTEGKRCELFEFKVYYNSKGKEQDDMNEYSTRVENSCQVNETSSKVIETVSV